MVSMTRTINFVNVLVEFNFTIPSMDVTRFVMCIIHYSSWSFHPHPCFKSLPENGIVTLTLAMSEITNSPLMSHILRTCDVTVVLLFHY